MYQTRTQSAAALSSLDFLQLQPEEVFFACA